MCSILRVFLALLLTVLPSLAGIETETEVDFEGRWITRPPHDQEFTFSVVINTSRSDEETCTGSLLTLKWVLTAARCMCKGKKVVEEKDTLNITAGLDKRWDDPNVQIRKSYQILVKEINGKQNCFSVALVELEEPFKEKVTGDKTLKTLTFPNEYPSDRLTEQICRSASFGRLSWNVRKNIEMKKMMTVVQPCNCSLSLQEAFPEAPVDQWMCGEYGYNLGLCKGDFGAALTNCEKNFMGVAIGIVSFGDLKLCNIKQMESTECEKKTTVSIYTDVCYHLAWINGKVPEVPVNTSSCDAPDSATSVRADNSWNVVIYSTFVYFFIVSSVN